MRYVIVLPLAVFCSSTLAQASEYDRGFNAGYRAGFADGQSQGMQTRDFDPTKSNQFPEFKRPEIVPDVGIVDDGRFQGFGNGVLDSPRGLPLVTE